jgi:hypothetical protein
MYPAERDGGKKRMKKESSTQNYAFNADNEPFPVGKILMLNQKSRL